MRRRTSPSLAQERVEHYEISGYTTARNLAQQLHQNAIVRPRAVTKSGEGVWKHMGATDSSK
jgi:hypothetical protein